jgi:hypothetical protein
MVPGTVRPPRGALMTVSLSSGETAEWNDPEFRAAARKDFERRARERGRRFVEVRDANGAPLALWGVT